MSLCKAVTSVAHPKPGRPASSYYIYFRASSHVIPILVHRMDRPNGNRKAVFCLREPHATGAPDDWPAVRKMSDFRSFFWALSCVWYLWIIITLWHAVEWRHAHREPAWHYSMHKWGLSVFYSCAVDVGQTSTNPSLLNSWDRVVYYPTIGDVIPANWI